MGKINYYVFRFDLIVVGEFQRETIESIAIVSAEHTSYNYRKFELIFFQKFRLYEIIVDLRLNEFISLH